MIDACVTAADFLSSDFTYSAMTFRVKLNLINHYLIKMYLC